MAPPRPGRGHAAGRDHRWQVQQPVDLSDPARSTQPRLLGDIAEGVIAGSLLAGIAYHAPRIAARDPDESDAHLKALLGAARGLRHLLDLGAGP